MSIFGRKKNHDQINNNNKKNHRKKKLEIFGNQLKSVNIIRLQNYTDGVGIEVKGINTFDFMKRRQMRKESGDLKLWKCCTHRNNIFIC